MWSSGDGRFALVHRPRYDDWTLPKGKLDPGETFEQAALREVGRRRGCGAGSCASCHPRATRVGERPKLVRYWLMAVVDDPGFNVNDEVDSLRWLSPREAAELLTYDRDREVLSAAFG